MKNKLTPITLRIVLFVGMFLIVGLFIATLMIGYKILSDFSSQTKQVAAQAEASNSSLNNLVTTKKALEENKDVVERASQIVSESKSYVYQDQIIRDLNQYANAHNVTITNISFGDTQTSGTGTSAPATAAPANGAAPTQPAAPTGVKSTQATVTIKNPVGYLDLLNFLHDIEQSLFKMKISQVTLSKPTDSNSTADQVNTDVLTIEVYVR